MSVVENEATGKTESSGESAATVFYGVGVDICTIKSYTTEVAALGETGMNSGTGSRFKGSRLFIIHHIHNHTGYNQ